MLIQSVMTIDEGTILKKQMTKKKVWRRYNMERTNDHKNQECVRLKNG